MTAGRPPERRSCERGEARRTIRPPWPWEGHARRAALVAALACVASGTASIACGEPPRSGLAFAGADVRAMQADDMQNPGMLWVERGVALWSQKPPDASHACVDCHRALAESMRGVATRYPAWDADAARVFDLEDRINACRVRRMGALALARESDDLLALTTAVANASRGLPMRVATDGPAHAAWERARDYYHARRGQMNLSCASCHEQSVGRRLLLETISEGHGNAWPAYRLEWQTQGSLQRRLRACLFGIRAEMPAEGAPELVELELYLASRAAGLAIESPGVRR